MSLKMLAMTGVVSKERLAGRLKGVGGGGTEKRVAICHQRYSSEISVSDTSPACSVYSLSVTVSFGLSLSTSVCLYVCLLLHPCLVGASKPSTG